MSEGTICLSALLLRRPRLEEEVNFEVRARNEAVVALAPLPMWRQGTTMLSKASRYEINQSYAPDEKLHCLRV